MHAYTYRHIDRESRQTDNQTGAWGGFYLEIVALRKLLATDRASVRVADGRLMCQFVPVQIAATHEMQMCKHQHSIGVDEMWRVSIHILPHSPSLPSPQTAVINTQKGSNCDKKQSLPPFDPCSWTYLCCAKHCPHCSQRCGLSPEWLRRCTVKSLSLTKDDGQSGHWKGRSPTCRRI